MLDLKDLKNQIKYFEYMDFSLQSYKMVFEGNADSLYDAIKKKKVAKLNNIPDSDVLAVIDIARSVLCRRLFTLAVREQEDFVDFGIIESKQEYKDFRDNILSKHPDLTQADCQKILRQICNAISHGDILSSFNFEEYEKRLKNFYDNLKTLSPTNGYLVKQFYSKKLVDLYYSSSNLIFNYESFFEFFPDGTKQKRTKPVKIKLTLTEDDIIAIVNLVLDYTMHEKIFDSILDNNTIPVEDAKDIIKSFKNSTKLSDFAKIFPKILKLDDIQKEAREDLKNHFIEVLKNHTKFSNDDKTAEMISLFSETIATQNVSLSNKYVFLKINQLLHAIELLPVNINESKRSYSEILAYNFKNDSKMFNDEENFYEFLSYVDFLDGNKFYKEMLIAEISAMLQIVEQNELKRKVGSSDIIQEIAIDFYEKDSFTDKEIITIIDNIRDAFVHGSYITNVEDKIEIYDQITRTDKTLEYKFTLYNEDLEKIKDACLDAFKDMKKDLENATTTPVSTSSTTLSTSIAATSAPKKENHRSL